MTVGDPRKALVLAVIALVVVCAAVYRLLPGAPARVPTRVADEVATASELPALAEEVADSVSIDPFSHPDLSNSGTSPDIKAQAKAAQNAEQRREIGVSGIRDREGIFGPLPVAAKTSAPPDKNAPVTPENSIEFRVEAVVRGDESLALVSLAGQGGIAVRSGTMLNSHVKIVEIKVGSVVIEASGKRVEVAVGDVVNL